MNQNPLATIVTRTKNRTIFFPRLFETVSNQTYRPIEWVIVNDAGESPASVINQLSNFYSETLQGIQIVLIERETSTTMEAASNDGVRNAQGKYILILDDDDTIEPLFMERTIGYLETEALPEEFGVVTHATQILECVNGEQIAKVAAWIFNPNIASIDLARIAKVNQYPPVSFLYRKSAWETLGGYDESLPVQGDWEFNLRFLSKYDVAFIPQPLANYHIRQCKNTDYSNTVTNKTLHMKYESIVRNKILRDTTGKWLDSLKVAIISGWNANVIEGKIIEQQPNQLTLKSQYMSALSSQLFLDLGDGYNEEISLNLPVAQNDESQTFAVALAGHENLTNLRLDPLNDSCVIEIEELKILRSDNTELDLSSHIRTNACSTHGKNYFFETIDPIITFDTLNAEELRKAVKLIATIRYAHIGREALEICIKQIKSELDQAKSELDQAKSELDQAKSELDQAKSSFSWRVAKPLRKIKQILKEN